ncbi:hypothetical protein ABLB90_08960 [Photorhabdus bodei]|uniref:DUF4158 domain-containing protein n=1 Tax=Photorhabdus bodei TaxID=2029681 RepID=UPI0032B7C0DF
MDWLERTGTRHRKEILEFLGIRRVSVSDKSVFSNWLIGSLCPHGVDATDATGSAFEWFKKHQVEYPAGKELDRLVCSAYQQLEFNLYEHIANRLLMESKVLAGVSGLGILLICRPHASRPTSSAGTMGALPWRPALCQP